MKKTGIIDNLNQSKVYGFNIFGGILLIAYCTMVLSGLGVSKKNLLLLEIVPFVAMIIFISCLKITNGTSSSYAWYLSKFSKLLRYVLIASIPLYLVKAFVAIHSLYKGPDPLFYSTEFQVIFVTCVSGIGALNSLISQEKEVNNTGVQ